MQAGRIADFLSARVIGNPARDALSEKKRATAATKLAKRGLPFKLLPGSIVSGYSPIRSEIDPMPLMRRLAEEGAKLGLESTLAVMRKAGVF